MFDYIKGSAKTKLADMRKNRNQRGVILTRMEERVVALCGLDNMDGEQELGEGGFRYEEVKNFYFSIVQELSNFFF